MLKLVLTLALTVMAGVAGARELDLSRPEDVILAEMRLDCSSDPSKPRLRWMTGRIVARRQGVPDQHLFDVQALNASACQAFDDARRGPGYRSVTREIMFYLDPATGQVIDQWRNPLTGETVPVVHMFNDPVNMPEPRFARAADGLPLKWEGRIVGDTAHIQRTNNFFRDNPMGGDFQDYVGGKYSVLELRTILIPTRDWLDTARPAPVKAMTVWSRIGPWLPWMKMGGLEGYTVLTSTWFSARNLAEAPEPLRSTVRDRYPQFAEAPPLDDPRPSVNSWDGVKRSILETRARDK